MKIVTIVTAALVAMGSIAAPPICRARSRRQWRRRQSGSTRWVNIRSANTHSPSWLRA